MSIGSYLVQRALRKHIPLIEHRIEIFSAHIQIGDYQAIARDLNWFRESQIFIIEGERRLAEMGMEINPVVNETLNSLHIKALSLYEKEV